MKFSMEEFDNYSPDLGAKFFSLKKNGDTARVRILYETMNDVTGSAVHKVNLKNGGFRFVECLRTYEDPQDCCPLCSSSVENDRKLQSRIWVPMYLTDTGETVLWERGKSFWKNQLYPLMVQHGKPFCGNVFTIERVGEAGDINTTYEFTFEGFDEKTLDDFDEVPSADSLVLSKSFEELEQFVKTRTFDSVEDGSGEAPDPFARPRNQVNGEGQAIKRRGISKPDV